MTKIDLDLSLRLSAHIGMPVKVCHEGSLLVAWMVDEPRCAGIGRDWDALAKDAEATKNDMAARS